MGYELLASVWHNDWIKITHTHTLDGGQLQQRYSTAVLALVDGMVEEMYCVETC